MSYIKNNRAKSYLIVGVTIMGLGAIKGLFNGLKREQIEEILMMEVLLLMLKMDYFLPLVLPVL